MTLERLMNGTTALGAAAVFGALGAFTLLRSYRRVTRGTSANGVVVGFVEQARTRPVTYAPEVEFKTAAGETVRFTASVSSSRKPKTGREVKVLYYEARAQDAEIASFRNLWLFPVVLLFLGLICLAVSIGVYTGVIIPD